MKPLLGAKHEVYTPYVARVRELNDKKTLAVLIADRQEAPSAFTPYEWHLQALDKGS
jgi:hypothetical protein